LAELRRGFGFWDVFALTFGSILGTGMFFGAALGAQYAGNVSLIAWAVLTIISVYIAACFGELVAMFPKAGGVYEYSKQVYGRFPSFLIGWIAWLQMNITTTLLVVAAIDYLTPAHFPIIYKILLSVIFIVGLNIIAFLGLEASSVTLIAFAIISVGLILAVVIPGAFHVVPSNYLPFFTHPWFFAFLAMFFMMETFFGWEAATYLAEETKEPEKTIPKALIWAAVTVSILAITVAVVLLGVFKWNVLSQLSAPFNSIAYLIYGGTGVYFIGIGVYLVLLGSAAGGIISSPRLLLAMARDKLFLQQFTAIHEKYRTPYKAVIFQTLVAIIVILIGFGKYEMLLTILVPMALLMYILALLAIPILRVKEPNRKRPFKVLFGIAGPIIVSLLLSGVVIYWAFSGNNWSVLLQSLYLILLGIPIYLLLEMYYDPKMIIRMNNWLARLTLWTEGISLPKSVRKEIVHELGNIKGQKVLEFGCNVGTFTEQLAAEVGSKGIVYATNTSKKELEITKQRLIRKGHKNVSFILEEDREGVSKTVPDVNLAVSIGVIGYVQNVEKMLYYINKRLDKGEKIFFVEYDNFFHLLPNTPWLNKDDKIKEVFTKAGFDVTVVRKKGILWQYIFISGIKKKNIEQKDANQKSKNIAEQR